MATPPGGLQEICFSFDTTGSMSSCLHEVRGRVQDMIQRLQADIPGIRIAVYAHGDYCDTRTYITKHVDFSTNVAELCDFVNSIGSTGGGDADECYELVLHKVQDLSWTPGSQRALVMIGDANPHEPNYGMNKKKLDWRKETKKLADMGVRIYGVECRWYGDPKDFYNTISQTTGGHRLKLSEFSNMFDFIMSICYREQGAEFLQIYEQEVRDRDARKGVHKDVDSLFGVLRSPSAASSSATTASATVKRPALTKVPSLTKVSSITALKKKTARPASPKKKRISESHKKRLALKTAKLNLKLPKAYNLRKLRRENVSESSFVLGTMEWSSWEVAISPENRLSDGSWEKRKNPSCGYRRKELFDGKNKKTALYEFSVQTNDGRRYTVYSKMCHSLNSDSSWESKLLGKKDVKSQIDDIIRKGCSVSVRRLIINDKSAKQNKEITSSLRCYDYAWRKQRRARSSHRCVVKSSIQISSDRF